MTALLDRSWAAAIAIAAMTVLGTSAVGLNLWFASGTFADVVALTYIVAMAAIVIEPDNLRLHQISAPLSVLFWGGRAGGFMELVIDQGRWDLWGAVAERGALMACVLTLHLLAARRIGHVQALAERGIEVKGG